MSKRVYLSCNTWTLVSDEDYERVSQHKWCRDGNGYVCRMESYYVDGKRKRRKILLHRFVMDAPAHLQVDHRWHNKLDNRRHRLRLATKYQNRCNARPKRNCSSQYKGVRFHKRDKAWSAEIRASGAPRYLGTFATEREAALAYDAAAYAAWGEFAYLNFPSELQVPT